MSVLVFQISWYGNACREPIMLPREESLFHFEGGIIIRETSSRYHVHYLILSIHVNYPFK